MFSVIYVVGFFVILLTTALLSGLQFIEEEDALLGGFCIALFWPLIIPFIIVYMVGAVIHDAWSKR